MKKFLLKSMLLLCALMVGVGSVWGETATKTEGFETATAGQTYNSTQTYTTAQSDCGIAWTMYYGTVSTNDKITNNNSAQMRYYTNMSGVPYIMTTTPVYGLTNVSFKARVSNNGNTMDVRYSSDGTNWTAISTGNTFAAASTAYDFSFDIPSGGKYIKISLNSTTGKSNLVIDNVVFSYTVHALTLSATNGSITALDGSTPIASGSQVAEGATLNISASGDAGYAFDSWSVTGTNSSVESTLTANTTFTMGTADATLTAAFVADETEYTVTCNTASNGNVVADIASALSGTTITLTTTPLFRYYTAGVTVTDASSNDVTVTQTGTNTYTFSLPASNVTVDASFSNTFTDVLNVDMTGVTSNSYSDWSAITSNSSAVYAGNTAKGNSGIQMRKLTDSKGASGIYTTASGGYARKVTVSWISNTTDGREVKIYGKNSAFSSLSDMSNGTELGTIAKGTSTEQKINGNYQFIGITAPDGTVYIAEIDIEWEQATTAIVNIASACTDGTKYYGTYSNSSAFVVPSDLTVSAISVSGGTLTVTDYATGDVVPANTGVMVSAATAGDKTITLSAETGTEKDGNMLKASSVAMDAENTKFYRLTMHNGSQIGFWWGADDGAAFSLGANKAYLAVPTTDASSPLRLWFEDEENNATSIEEIKTAEDTLKFIENGQLFIKKDGITYDVLGRIVK